MVPLYLQLKGSSRIVVARGRSLPVRQLERVARQAKKAIDFQPAEREIPARRANWSRASPVGSIIQR